MFGIKDLFTTINLLGGVIAICLCIEGRPFDAGVAVLLGYTFGDVLDGWVARKLGTSNQFGAEYDTIADHLAHVIAPAAIVYTVYRDAGLVAAPYDKVLAGFLAACLIVSSSIRHARNIVAPVEFKGVWAGLPRTVLGFMAIGYCNAALAPGAVGGWWLGVGLIPLISVATLTRWPFPNHHLPRKHWPIVRVAIVSFFALSAFFLVWKPRFLFDILFFYMFGYSGAAWMSLNLDERARFREAVAKAKAIQ